MSHHPERTARNVRPVNQPPSFFFDNSMLEMRFIAEYSKESGFASVAENTPAWFASHVLAKGAEI